MHHMWNNCQASANSHGHLQSMAACSWWEGWSAGSFSLAWKSRGKQYVKNESFKLFIVDRFCHSWTLGIAIKIVAEFPPQPPFISKHKKSGCISDKTETLNQLHRWNPRCHIAHRVETGLWVPAPSCLDRVLLWAGGGNYSPILNYD